jgi:cytosine/adenosine deaminase-related metal-dependent hydrolase
VIRFRREQTPAEVEKDVAAGVTESVRCGTTLLGDISALGLSWPVLKDAPLRSVVFYELLGLPKSRAETAWVEATEWLQERSATPVCRPGLSPHAPYSIHSSIFFAVGTRGVPVMVHLAEIQDEMQLLRDRRGAFISFLRDFNVWDPEGLAEGPEQVLRLLSGPAPVLIAHGNYLQPGVPIPANATIVYCPRTHAAFGHPPHPFRDFLARGVRVALGTDSLASNPDLDVLAEARFLHRRYPDLDGAQLLRMATLSGAEALGWQQETGSLEPGKSADLAVVPLPDEDAADPHQLLFASPLVVRAVLWRGRWTVGP